ncbi:MAG: hypothetical protein ACLPVI_10385, partial [Dehalococcoidales bacterium]
KIYGIIRPSPENAEDTAIVLHSSKGDTEGFIRGTVQGISSSNSAESFQFGSKPQIASYHHVYREGRRIPNFKKSSLKF